MSNCQHVHTSVYCERAGPSAVRKSGRSGRPGGESAHRRCGVPEIFADDARGVQLPSWATEGDL
eukprot:1664607-Prymnesium_polylepis.1